MSNPIIRGLLSVRDQIDEYLAPEGKITPTVVWNSVLHGIVSGFAAHSVVHFVSVLKVEGPFQKILGGVSNSHIETAAGVIALVVGLSSAKWMCAEDSKRALRHSRLSYNDPDDLLRDMASDIAASWARCSTEYNSAIRLATMALFGPALLRVAQTEIPAGTALVQRVLKGVVTAQPWVQSVYDRLAGLGANGGAVFAFTSVTVSCLMGPSALGETKSNYETKYPLMRALWEVPMTISLTHLVLKTLSIPVTDSLADSIKFASILSNLAKHLDYHIVRVPFFRVQAQFQAHI